MPISELFVVDEIGNIYENDAVGDWVIPGLKVKQGNLNGPQGQCQYAESGILSPGISPSL
jgi:hypothetical protein